MTKHSLIFDPIPPARSMDQAMPNSSTPQNATIETPIVAHMAPLKKYLMIFSVSGSALLPVSTDLLSTSRPDVATVNIPHDQTFLSGCLTVALPTIQQKLNIDDAHLQWPLTAYSLTYGCFLLLSGK